MRKVTPIVLVLAQTASILVAFNWVLEPPLKVAAPEEEVSYAAMRRLSEPAIAGSQRFGSMCAQCHGFEAEGTDIAPALLNRPYATDFRNSKMFHDITTREIPAHSEVLRAADGNGSLDFNTLEKMSKFLREMRRVELRRDEG